MAKKFNYERDTGFSRPNWGPERRRKKRKPTAYNKFIGKCTKEKKGPITERMKKCAREWKKEKKRMPKGLTAWERETWKEMN